MAVYTRIEKKDLSKPLSVFDIGEIDDLSGIAEGVENSNYLLTTAKGKFILTLFEKRVNVEELPYYIGFMGHLKKKGVPCPDVVVGGKTKVFTLSGKTSLITTFLEGAWPRDITADYCAKAGALIAGMHLAAGGFNMKRKNAMAWPAWQSLIHSCRTQMDDIETGLFHALDAELEFLAKNKPKGLPEGAVHADLFPDNVFFKDGIVSGVIDFYFACNDIFAYDLMLAFNAWCFDGKGGLDLQKSNAFLSGYQAVRSLSGKEIAALPYFGRAAAMRVVATRSYDSLNPAAGALVTPKDPVEHIKILRFHQNIKSAKEYGWQA